MRVCSQSGCGVLISKAGYCTTHARVREQARGTRQARGYDAAFDRAKQEPEYVTATHCETCGERFTTDNPKTAGHLTAIRDGGRGSGIKAECRRCNYGWRRTGS